MVRIVWLYTCMWISTVIKSGFGFGKKNSLNFWVKLRFIPGMDDPEINWTIMLWSGVVIGEFTASSVHTVNKICLFFWTHISLIDLVSSLKSTIVAEYNMIFSLHFDARWRFQGKVKKVDSDISDKAWKLLVTSNPRMHGQHWYVPCLKGLKNSWGFSANIKFLSDLEAYSGKNLYVQKILKMWYNKSRAGWRLHYDSSGSSGAS